MYCAELFTQRRQQLMSACDVLYRFREWLFASLWFIAFRFHCKSLLTSLCLKHGCYLHYPTRFDPMLFDPTGLRFESPRRFMLSRSLREAHILSRCGWLHSCDMDSSG